MPARKFAEAGAPPIQGRERRPASLGAFATRKDGSVVEMTVVDLSIDGCGVLCPTHLDKGEMLNLAVLRRGTVGAVVRWSEGGRAGLSFTQEPTGVAPVEPRCHERIAVDGEVSLRRAGKTQFRVHIYDICPDGCKAEFVDRPELGEQLWIKFDSMDAVEANVRWITGAKAGLRFSRPLHAAVFAMLIGRLGALNPP